MTYTTEHNMQEVLHSIRGAAPIFHAFLECSSELQDHAKSMMAIIADPATDDDDREFAVMTLADILFPNTHEGDKMLGLDLKDAEELAKQHPESKAVLDRMDEEEATFAERLERQMAARGLTQTELAQRVGVGQPAIAMMLKRECRPQKRTVARLAEALDVTPDELWPGFKK